MNSCMIPEGYHPSLNLYDTQVAIAMTKRVFEDTLSGALQLRRVSAPLLLDASTGLNDDLNGVERYPGPGGSLPGQMEAPGPAPLPFYRGHRYCNGYERHPSG
mgnify:CR=1 FL=1